MATIAVTTNLNQQITDALHAADPAIVFGTSSDGVVLATATARLIHRPHMGTIFISPANPSQLGYSIDFVARPQPAVWCGGERWSDAFQQDMPTRTVFAVRDVLGVQR